VEDFFRNPEKTYFQISPDATYFSWLGPYENRMNLFIRRIGTDDVIRLTKHLDRDIAGYLWASDGRILYTKDEAGNENFRLYGIDADGSHFADLTPYDSVRIQLIDDLPDDPNRVIIGMNKENQSLFEPYRLDIHTGEVIQLAENKDPQQPISDWVTDHHGNIRMAIQVVDGVNKNILYRDSESGPFLVIMSMGFEDSFQPLFFDFNDEPVIYAATNIQRDKEAIVRYDVEKHKILEVVFSHPDVDVGSLDYSRKRKVPTYASFTTDKTYRHYLDDTVRSIFNSVQDRLPGYEIFLVNHDRDEDKFLVRTFSDKSKGGYFLYNTLDSSLEHLVDISPWIDERDMADMKPIEYRARDGMIIHGYLTLPKGVDPVGLPVVINPHGGPWARNTWGYNPEVQLFASRGYAVLQMNFRGSTGYGKSFWKASFKEWGRKMQDDISDGLNYLVDTGIADPGRIAIYGGSYGGYAALAGAAFTPDLYACAVDYVGVSNLHTFLETIPPYWKPYREMMYAMVGDPVADSTRMASASPVNFADNILCPLFVAQGANDPRVHINESDQIVRALRDRNIEVSYMVKYDEGHGFKNEENRMDFYHAMMGFMEEHLIRRKQLHSRVQ
jgi:dipeptidyl aminopeptidase/acylaminoacyl peptidase